MADSELIEFDWVISLLVQNIAADLMIQEEAMSGINDARIFRKAIRRCQLHTRLLQLVLQIKQRQANGSIGSTDLIQVLSQIEASSADLVKISVNRSKPLLNVLCEEKLLDACLRLGVILLLLEDSNLSHIYIGLRNRSGYVSVRFDGGRIKNSQLLDRQLLALLSHVISRFGGGVVVKSNHGKRRLYVRLNLSNQLNLIE